MMVEKLSTSALRLSPPRVCGGASFPFEVWLSINSIEELNALAARVKSPASVREFHATTGRDQVNLRAAALAAADARIWPKWRPPNLV